MRCKSLSWLRLLSLGFQGLSLVSVIGLSATAAMAQRTRDYTPTQFISVLNGLGYPVKLTDSLQLPLVRQAIRDFQLRHRLPVTGTMTPATQDQAAVIVQRLQKSLNQTLRLPTALPQSQYYGSQTESFIKVFQERNRLPITGIATSEIRRQLLQKLSSSRVVARPISNITPVVQARSNGASLIPPLSPAPSPPPVKAVPAVAPRLPAIVSPPSPSRPQQRVMVQPVGLLSKPVRNVRFGRIYTELEFRRVLQGMGYDINPTKFLSDPSAIVALQDFQMRYGLAITGTADQPTQAMARKILRVLQYNLRLVGGQPNTITEFYDTATESAVRAFQQRNQLRVDGIATVSVRRRIDNQAKQRLK